MTKLGGAGDMFGDWDNLLYYVGRHNQMVGMSYRKYSEGGTVVRLAVRPSFEFADLAPH